MSWDQLSVKSVVVHYIPTTRDDPDGTLVLTHEEIPLDPSLRSYFRDKIAERLEDKGLEVVDDPENDSPVPALVREIVADPTTLVDGSRKIATHLDETQSGINSSGLIAVATAAIGQKAFVAVVKLERERGIRFAINEVDGKNVVDMELLKNLTLTDKTKVYKTAMLGPDGATGLKGYVADDQRGRKDGVEVATFFLSRFLGCKPRVPAARMTYAFVQAANVTINKDVPSAETRGRYQVALLATLQDNTADLRPSTFANANLDAEHREPFLARLEEAGVPRNATFAKDTSLVKVTQFRMTFESGMVLVGSKEDLEERLDVPKNSGPEKPVQVKDTVDKIIAGR